MVPLRHPSCTVVFSRVARASHDVRIRTKPRPPVDFIQSTRRVFQMDQLSYFCESCPRNRYSLDYGYLNYSLTYSSFAYFTLLINGQQPEVAYSGSYIYHDIECLECPYGARCQQVRQYPINFFMQT